MPCQCTFRDSKNLSDVISRLKAFDCCLCFCWIGKHVVGWLRIHPFSNLCKRSRWAADVSLTAVHAYSFPRNLIPPSCIQDHILNLMKLDTWMKHTWGSRSWRRCTPRRGCPPAACLWTRDTSSGLAGLQCRWERERLESLSSLFANFLRKNTHWAMHFSKRWTALNPRMEKMTAHA